MISRKKVVWVALIICWSVLVLFGLHRQRLPDISQPKPTKNEDFASLYWEQRKDSTATREKVEKMLATVNLWRPMDKTDGIWSRNYSDRFLPQLIWTAHLQPTRVNF